MKVLDRLVLIGIAEWRETCRKGKPPITDSSTVPVTLITVQLSDGEGTGLGLKTLACKISKPIKYCQKHESNNATCSLIQGEIPLILWSYPIAKTNHVVTANKEKVTSNDFPSCQWMQIWSHESFHNALLALNFNILFMHCLLIIRNINNMHIMLKDASHA